MAMFFLQFLFFINLRRRQFKKSKLSFYNRALTEGNCFSHTLEEFVDQRPTDCLFFFLKKLISIEREFTLAVD